MTQLENGLASARHFGALWLCACGAENPSDYDSCHGCERPAWECAHCGTATAGDACTQCGGTVSSDDNPELAEENWLNRQIGPRKVGGRYDHGYQGSAYEVLAIDRGPRPSWPTWQITVRYDEDSRITTHCTAWDPAKDRVLAEPPARTDFKEPPTSAAEDRTP
ncbi:MULTISPECIES: hypothetical protein [unclassified Streptomyces]|uniref:hypothetical protein n=1 Tax=unclassified Streptomyces TaxID=2593676 RepID=UPI0023659351|nr:MULTISPECIES: hypothetical protein [unclassified Streptomyces]MDF3144165.1 hypothetical protein [Streptomyces sp. T21Q-yed]WDF45081.1 hypothetical protein PBV52_51190 [Streptomyces sp. T12]